MSIAERIAQAIEAEFIRWDSQGNTVAPHPLHSEGWLVERSFAAAAEIARSFDVKGDQ